MVQQEDKRPLFLFVGKSASGKTTIANMLEKDGYNQVQSYTTRPPRYKGEVGHTFISEGEYDKLENIVASTLYNGYHYCTTLEQIQNSDFYVVDVPGVFTLLDNYDKINRDIHIFYFDANVYNRIQRMIARHDSDTLIISRLLNDEKDDWLTQLFFANMYEIDLHIIEADNDLEEVYHQIKTVIKNQI